MTSDDLWSIAEPKVQMAAVTLALNVGIAWARLHLEPDEAIRIMHFLAQKISDREGIEELQYRAVAAFGTMMYLSSMLSKVAVEVYGLRSLILSIRERYGRIERFLPLISDMELSLNDEARTNGQ